MKRGTNTRATKKAAQESPRKYLLWFWLLVILCTAVRLVFATLAEITPDEAYYWTWSTRPDVGYFDHPPMAAWLIGFSTSIFGTHALAIRLPAIILSIGTTILLFAIARALGASRRTAFWTALLGNASLIFTAGAALMTPDAPLSFFWALALLAAAKLVKGGGERYWYLGGAALGLALLSKYSAFLLGPSVLLVFLLSPELRPRLKKPAPYLALALALALFAPVLYWNHQNGWVSISYHLNRSLPGGSGMNTLGQYLGAQFMLLTPVIAYLFFYFFIDGLRALWRRNNTTDLLLAGASIPLWLLFLTLSLAGRIEPNWPAIAYLAAAPGMALALERRRGKRTLGLIAVVSGFAVTLAIMVHVLFPYLPISAKRDVSNRLWGWEALAREVARKLPPRGGTRIVSLRYQEASVLRLYLIGNAQVASITTSEGYWRKSQYDLWPAPRRRAVEAVLFIAPVKERFNKEKALGGICPGQGKKMGITLKRGEREIRKYLLYLCKSRSVRKEALARGYGSCRPTRRFGGCRPTRRFGNGRPARGRDAS